MSTEFKLYNVNKEELYSNKSTKEREKLLYEMVQSAYKRGVKPTARWYNTYPSTVRRWVKRYEEGGKEALKITRKKVNKK